MFRVYDSESVDGFVSDFRLVSGRVVSFSVLRTSLESGRLSCYYKQLPQFNNNFHGILINILIYY